MKRAIAAPPDVSRRRLFTISAPAPEKERAFQIKTILVPVDFSGESLRALEYAILVAPNFGAAIHVVHVRPSKETSAIKRAGNLLANYTVTVDFLRDRLVDIERKHAIKFLPDNCRVEAGRPSEEICKIARAITADIIIMGTRGQSGLPRLLLGSTAERVIRFAPCPVLIPRGRRFRAVLASAKKFELKIQKILVPVDFSKCSLAGIECAALLGRRFNARIKFLHVIAPCVHVLAANGLPGQIAPLIEAARTKAEKQMGELRRAKFLSGLSCEAETPIGDIVGEIYNQSAACDIDLLVISTHGRSGFRHALLGSIAEHVARYAECPVMTVPSRET